MKDKLKPLVKEAKKTAQKNIQQTLLIQLKEITAKFGEASKKLDKKIAKESKKLAKKLVKDVKLNKAVLGKTDEKPAVPETPKAATPVKAKPAAGPAVKKPVAKISAS